jgi:predicted RNA-binding protein with TRAM domain
MEGFRGRGGGFGGGRGGFGGRDRGFNRFPPKPVKVGEEYDVEIESVAEKGDGIAKVKGLIVFVPGTQKGDKVKIKITDVRARCAIAQKVGEGSEAPSEEAAPEEAPAETAASAEETSQEVVDTEMTEEGSGDEFYTESEEETYEE